MPAKPPVNRSPASIRYWKAKLQVLKRPAVWGSALVLLLPLVLLADYWQNPDKLVAPGQTANPNQANDAASGLNPALTEANRSLPNSEALDSLLNASRNKPGDKAPTQASSAPRNTSIPPNKLPDINLSDTFGAPTSTASSAASAQTAGSSETLSSNSSSATTPVLSPLQSALSRSGTQSTGQTKPEGLTGSLGSSYQTGQMNQANQTGRTTTDLYGQSGSSFNQSLTGQSAQPSGYQAGYQPYVPQTSPAAGTTGYTVPPAFRTTTNTSGFGAAPSSAVPIAPAQPAPAAYGNPPSYDASGSTSDYRSPRPSFSTPSDSAAQSQPAPFSVPRTPPGRYIGGGQINTFSNP